MKLTFSSPFSYGLSNYSKTFPSSDLLLYLNYPNSDKYLVGEDTEIGEDTYIWGYLLPDNSDIRSATGWVNGTANVFYTATGVPIVALATEIAAAILPANVVFSLVDATTQMGKLAIFTTTTTEVTLGRARSALRDESINRLFYGVDGIWYDPQDLATMYQDAQGTLPVYRPGSGAVDPPVGLMMDKSMGLELGPELWNGTLIVTNSTSGANGVYNSATGELSNTVAGTASYLPSFYNPNIGVEVNKFYRVKLKFSGNLAPLVSVTLHAGSTTPGFSTGGVTGNAIRSAGGEIEYIGVNQITAPGIRINTDGTTTWSGLFIDSISIREIKGYHAYQTTPTARPTLSGRYNLLTATETLSTQSVTTVATDYTLRFEGAGTITLSGTATGVKSAGTHTITCTDGTLTCTVAGTVTQADLRVKRDGSSLPPYQRTDDADTYDTNDFPLYLKRDRVDDDLIVQAPAITGSWAHGAIDGPVLGSVAIPAGEYHPFGAIPSHGLPDCTQWIAIDGALNASEQAVLERYAYAKGQQLIDVPQFGSVSSFVNFFRARTELLGLDVSRLDTSNVTTFLTAFYNNQNLVFNRSIDVSSKCTNLTSSFFANKAMQSYDISGWDCTGLISAPNIFKDCVSLTTVIVGNAFDNTPCTDFTNAFLNTNLNQSSVDAILVSINTAGTSNGTFDQSGGSAPSATGQAAITAMRSRGWIVTVTGGF